MSTTKTAEGRTLQLDDLPCVCGSKRYVIVLEGRYSRWRTRGYPFAVVRCEGCGLHRTNPSPYDETTVARVYEEGFGGGQGDALSELGSIGPEEEGPWRKFAFEILDELRPWAPQGRLLDIGCSSGALLAAAQERGYEVSGVELNSSAAAYAAQRTGRPVHIGTLVDRHFDDDSFEVVTINHVLEHVIDPVATLSEIRRVLVPGGTLFVGVPNFASLMRRVHRTSWYGLQPQLHVWQFTPRTLASLAQKAGLAVRGVNTRRNMLYGFERTLRGMARWGAANLGETIRSGDNLRLLAQAP